MSNRIARGHYAGFGGVAAFLFFLMADGWGGVVAQPPVTALRVEHLMRPQSVEALEFEAMSSDLEKKRIARLIITAAKPADGAARHLIDGVRAGALEMAVVPLASLGTYVPRFRAFEIPFLFHDTRHRLSVQFADRDFKLLDELRSAKLEAVGWWPGETLVLASRKPVLEPTDLRGLRAVTLSARSSGEASALLLLAEKLGAVPKDLPWSQVAAGLERGDIDVIEAVLTDLHQLRAPKLSVTLTQHLYAGYVVIANPARWAGLPLGVQAALREHLQRAHDTTHRKIVDAAAAARRELAQERGAVFFSMPSKEIQNWRNALRSEHLAGAAGNDFIKYVERSGFFTASVSRGSGPEISWNAWFEDGPESVPKDVAAFELNGVYRFYLDLSRYPYTSDFSAKLGRPVEELLGGKGERRLLLQPVLLGAQIGPAPGIAMRPQALTVKLERARADPKDGELLEAFDKGRLTTRALSGQVNLGGFVSWEIKAQAIGCGGIAVTVWDQARVTPLDHIVLQIPVRNRGTGPKKCGWNDTAKSMNAGLLTLLAGPAPRADARAPDAALHVFESSDDGKVRSHAVFIHRRRLLEALANPKAIDPGVYSWQLASGLSTYVSDASQMPELIKAAHKAVAQPVARPFPFEDVAFELAQKVFGGTSEHDRREGARAQAALRDAVEKAAEPTVIVRLVSTNGETVFIPFGLLAAQAKKPEVPKRFTVIQPLPQPRPARSSCIDTWRIARPRELQGVGGDARDLLLQAADAAPAPGISVIDNHASLAGYLASNEGAVADRGDGLVVLAHHDSGYLKFNDADRPPARIAHEYIKREFQSGSAAILAACTTTGNITETRLIVDQLARQGVDALIVSPFAVDAEFGTRLALEFEKVVAEERGRRGGITLLQVFERAAARVATVYKNQGALRDMALEFMLIGNPEIRLCN